MTMFLCEALWVCLSYEKCYINKVALPCPSFLYFRHALQQIYFWIIWVPSASLPLCFKPSHIALKTVYIYQNAQNVLADCKHWMKKRAGDLDAGVPIVAEGGVREGGVGQMELGLHCLQVLAEAQAGEQMDLPMGEARLHPLLQQLQHILEATTERWPVN